MPTKILIIEDEIAIRLSLRKLLELKKFQVDTAETIKEAEKKLEYYGYDIYLLDMRLPDGHGMDLLEKFKPKLEEKTIIITAHATISSAVEAVRSGAFYYLEKPLDEELLFIQMDRIMELTHLKEQNLSFKNELLSQHATEDIVFKSEKMERLVALAIKFAQSDTSILLQGNTGVGKEIIAKFIHDRSPRKNHTFLPINCSSIPEQLFESELFGFKKGAFTGASDSYNGRFAQAHKGTLFLDEIGEMPLHLQAKLLRVLEDGMIYQLGNKTPQKVDVRLIAATNKNLRREAEAGRFREDLYFRLKGSMLCIPPLKERKDDILPLVRHFIGVYNELFDKQVNRLTREAEVYLNEYPWDGNVRELKNAVKSVMTLKSDRSISLTDLKIALQDGDKQANKSFLTLQEHELDYIAEVLRLTGFNVKRTSEILDISRSRLYRKIDLLDEETREKLKLENPGEDS